MFSLAPLFLYCCNTKVYQAFRLFLTLNEYGLSKMTLLGEKLYFINLDWEYPSVANANNFNVS
ncbi:hypothetical protein ABH966_004076 [Lysinibacillus sp. RC46]